MSKENGGPAFPYGVKSVVRDGYGEGERVIDYNEAGMTLRDYFAAAALQGWYASMDDAPFPDKGAMSNLVEMFYETADAMLKERAK